MGRQSIQQIIYTKHSLPLLNSKQTGNTFCHKDMIILYDSVNFCDAVFSVIILFNCFAIMVFLCSGYHHYHLLASVDAACDRTRSVAALSNAHIYLSSTH